MTMNDTLRRLSLQADAWCDQNCIDHPLYNVQWEQKFAELIVKECANIINSLEQYEGPGDSSKAEYLKEHFGVE